MRAGSAADGGEADGFLWRRMRRDFLGLRAGGPRSCIRWMATKGELGAIYLLASIRGRARVAALGAADGGGTAAPGVFAKHMVWVLREESGVRILRAHGWSESGRAGD